MKGDSIMTMIQIQDELAETVNAGIARWSHRKGGGHAGRIRGGAIKQARRKLAKLGFTEPQINHAIKDALDVAELERRAIEYGAPAYLCDDCGAVMSANQRQCDDCYRTEEARKPEPDEWGRR